MYFFKNQNNYYWEHNSSLSQHFISPYVTAQCIKVDQAGIITFIPRHKYVIREFGYDFLLGIKKLRLRGISAKITHPGIPEFDHNERWIPSLSILLGQ